MQIVENKPLASRLSGTLSTGSCHIFQPADEISSRRRAGPDTAPTLNFRACFPRRTLCHEGKDIPMSSGGLQTKAGTGHLIPAKTSVYDVLSVVSATFLSLQVDGLTRRIRLLAILPTNVFPQINK